MITIFHSVVDTFLLWVFIKISKLWFSAVVFGTDPEDGRTTSLFFFVDGIHAEQCMNFIEKEKQEKNDN